MKKLFLMTSVAMLSLGIINKSWADINPNCNCPGGTCECNCDNGTNCCSCIIKMSSCGDNCNWSIDNGVLNISGSGAMYNVGWEYVVEGNAEHPDVFNAAPWEGENFTSVVINGVSSVGANVFDSNENITSVTIGESVESLGDCAFCYASNIESVTFAPNSKLISIGADAFSGMKLTNITLPDSLESIGDWAFYGTGLTSIAIPDSVNLEERVFDDTNITEVTCINTKGQCEALQSLLSSQGINATFNTITPPPSTCPAGTFSVGGECLPRRYTPAELADIVGESNTILLYYK